jgi:translation initiation factor 3 subunit I
LFFCSWEINFAPILYIFLLFLYVNVNCYFFKNNLGDSMQLITASADQSVKLWNVQTGAQLYTFSFNSPARSVDFSVGDKLAVITTDPFMGVTSAINVKRIADDPSQRKSVNVERDHVIFFVMLLNEVFFFFFVESGESVLTITGPAGRINRAVWGPLNRTIISAGEDCVVRIWDSEVTR